MDLNEFPPIDAKKLCKKPDRVIPALVQPEKCENALTDDESEEEETDSIEADIPDVINLLGVKQKSKPYYFHCSTMP